MICLNNNSHKQLKLTARQMHNVGCEDSSTGKENNGEKLKTKYISMCGSVTYCMHY